MNSFERVSNERFWELKKKFTAGGWFKEMDRAYTNGTYSVIVRTLKTEYGLCKHAAIRNIDSTEIKWSEKQEIKNKIFGKNYVAVEVFPADDDLVDEANMYHLWVLPLQYKFPFNLMR